MQRSMQVPQAAQSSFTLATKFDLANASNQTRTIFREPRPVGRHFNVFTYNLQAVTPLRSSTCREIA